MRRVPRWAVRVAAVLAVVLVAAFVFVALWLPGYAEKRINEAIAASEQYEGGVQDVDIDWWRRSVVAEGFRVVAVKDEVPLRELAVPHVALQLHVDAIWKRALVGDLVFYEPSAHYSQVAVEEAEEEAEQDLPGVLAGFPPFRVRHLVVADGTFVYEDRQQQSPIRMTWQGIDLDLENLTNLADAARATAVGGMVRGELVGGGRAFVALNSDPMISPAPLYVDARLDDVALPYIGDLVGQAFGGGTADARLVATSRFSERRQEEPVPDPRQDDPGPDEGEQVAEERGREKPRAPGPYQMGTLNLLEWDAWLSLHADGFDMEVESLQELVLDEVDAEIDWSPAREQAFVITGRIVSPELVFVREGAVAELDPEDPSNTGMDAALKDVPPFRVERVVVEEGTVTFVDPTVEPPVDVTISQARLEIRDLTNVESSQEGLARAELDAVVGGTGRLRVQASAAPLVDPPTFDLDAELAGLKMDGMNDVWEAYGSFDVSEGVANVFVEVASEDGEFEGYVKPLIRDVDLYQASDWKKGLWQGVQEAAMGLAGEILENEPANEQLASEVPLEGRYQNPEVDVWRAIVMVLHNAFVEALLPRLDARIGLEDVG